MYNGTLAVAVVQHHIMVVQGEHSHPLDVLLTQCCSPAARSHSRCERWFDVHTFTPFGERVFFVSDVPHARIPSADILAIFPYHTPTTSTDMIELPGQAWNEFLELSAKNQNKCESMWRGWSANLR